MSLLARNLMAKALQVPNVISTPSVESIGVGLANLGAGAPASATWPTANKAFYIPFRLQRYATVRHLFAVNGSTAAGNIDMGIYNSAGTRLVSIGSTAQSGTSTLQQFDITDTPLAAGIYYLAIAKDDTTGTVIGWTSGLTARLLRPLGMLEQTSAFPLPATATFAAVASGVAVPYCGLSMVTVY